MLEDEMMIERLQEKEAELKELLKQHQIPGCSICVSHNAQTIWSLHHGFAHTQDDIPVTKDTIYRVGSVTKPFTAMLMMQLRDKGLFRLDESLSTYEPLLDLVKRNFSDSVPITFRMVASHISGLPKTIEQAEDMRQMTMEECIEMLTILTPPWSIINYSSLGYSILSKVLERVAGSSYRQLVASNILEPLQLKQTGFIETANVAQGYTLSPSGLKQISYPSTQHPSWEDGTSGLFSTAEDLIRFIHAQFEGSKLLNRYSLKEMQSPVMLEQDFSRGTGLAWFLRPLNGFTIAEHGGEVKGFTSYIGFVPNVKLGVCVLLNSDERLARRIGQMLLDIMLPANKNESSKRKERLNRLLRQTTT
ncbi:serine hydrolase domain-containing protein [Bacillus sp. NPDC077027]|uniref:serine hydrolase domain-containing protein n=1 Tax=Bacillus sp. NPDC077027 TaxID=3390548 RepID=UPI003D0535BA